MKSRKEIKGLAIWLPCSIFVIIVTACVVLVNSILGVVGIPAVLFLLFASLQFYKWTFLYRAKQKEYNLDLVISITNSRIVYLIMLISLGVSWLFSTLFTWAEDGVFGVPKSVYCIIIILLAVLMTLKPIQPFVKKEKFIGKRRSPASLINAFVPRFVILYTFVVYFFFSFATYTSSSEIIPLLCVVYIAIERMMSMFQTVSEYSQQEYYSMFRETVKWIRKERGN